MVCRPCKTSQKSVSLGIQTQQGDVFSYPQRSTGISLQTRLVNYPRFQANRNRKIVHCGGKQQQTLVLALFLS